METNRADRLADALASALSATDRRSLLALSEPAKLIAEAIRPRQGSAVLYAGIPVGSYSAGPSRRVPK